MFPLFRTRGVSLPSAVSVTLLTAAAGGALFALLGLPAPWLSGSLVAVSALALAGFPARMPELLRKVIFLLLGVSIGGAVTPETLASMWNWPITLGFLVLSMPVVMIAVVLYLNRVAGWDRETAYYASAPGAMSAVIAAAMAAGVDVRRVAFAQSVRVFFLIAALPGLFAVLGLSEPGAAMPPAPPLADDPFGFVLMLVIGAAAGLLAERVGLPGGLIVGSMVASAILHGSGQVEAQMPAFVLNPALAALGAMMGVRFAGTDLALLRQVAVASFGAFVVALVVTLLFAALASAISGEELAKTVLAFAPGGLEAMTILAFVIGLDPAFVGAHHLARFFLVAVSLPVMARFVFGKPGS